MYPRHASPRLLILTGLLAVPLLVTACAKDAGSPASDTLYDFGSDPGDVAVLEEVGPDSAPQSTPAPEPAPRTDAPAPQEALPPRSSGPSVAVVEESAPPPKPGRTGRVEGVTRDGTTGVAYGGVANTESAVVNSPSEGTVMDVIERKPKRTRAPSVRQAGSGRRKAAARSGSTAYSITDMHVSDDVFGGEADRDQRVARAKRKKRRTRTSAVPMTRVAAEHPMARPSAEAYEHIAEREYSAVKDAPLSTFSIDVDTASYANMRRFLNHGSLPPADAVRVEELVNYFDYDYSTPRGSQPFAVNAEVSDCPWNDEARLVQIGIKGKEINQEQTPRRNLVFLLDVSGSMNSADKLPLLKRAMSMLTQNLRPDDMVSIVVYAGASGVVLPPTSGEDKGEIMAALDRLRAGGSTNGAGGIELAYQLAQRNFDPAGINRVILATDGDFNVGTTSRGALTRLIEKKRSNGVFLSVLGFGSGNVKDSTMELLADKGNGNYAYIDSVREARKVLVEEAGATLVTIAKDVKIQVEFNPAEVASYRLVGYENRALKNRDFNDDTKDAGEIGAGHTVTAMYEVIPNRGQQVNGEVDELRYQRARAETPEADGSGELMHVKLRYKAPQGRKSKLVSYTVRDRGDGLAQATNAFRFAASVSAFGLLLRNSPHARDMSMSDVFALASGALGRDDRGYRREFLGLVQTAAQMRGETVRGGPVASIAR